MSVISRGFESVAGKVNTVNVAGSNEMKLNQELTIL